ncbi:VOC family protein [Ruegeria sp. 2205SS24-7]|uniref:VOC family protein n=1 Tax=Ruegeria discodermiae TaxID=3064389 RepID=UPI0027409F1F|nr:VOC family protein [Ruegeria sp. 2205SS24-7]MDP5216841.1 VOC family protein [Ruegeria sp. 2205SS24-7]
MDQRVSLITVGTKDMEGSARFYEALGWQRVETPDGVIAFDLIGQVLGLYPLDKLAEDIGCGADDLGQGATTLSYNCAAKEQVSELLTAAEAAGAAILKPASDVFWGGHHGYFRAPEGTVWEVAHNPFSALGPNGEFRWNGYG